MNQSRSVPIQKSQLWLALQKGALTVLFLGASYASAKVSQQCDSQVQKLTKMREALKNADGAQRGVIASGFSVGGSDIKDAFKADGALANLAADGARFQQKLNEMLYGRCLKLCKSTNPKTDPEGQPQEKCKDFKKQAQSSAEDAKGAEDDAAKAQEGEKEVDSGGQGQMPPMQPPKGDEGGGDEGSEEPPNLGETETTETDCATAEKQVQESGAKANSLLVQECNKRFINPETGKPRYALVASAVKDDEDDGKGSVVGSEDPRNNNIASLESDVENFEKNYGYNSNPNSAASAGQGGGGGFSLGGVAGSEAQNVEKKKTLKGQGAPNAGPSLKVGGSGGGSSGGGRSAGGAAPYYGDDDSFDLMNHFMKKRNKKNMGSASALFGGGRYEGAEALNPRKTMPATFESISTGFFRYCLKFKHCPSAQLETMRRALK